MQSKYLNHAPSLHEPELHYLRQILSGAATPNYNVLKVLATERATDWG
jgi:hypothetical protein